MINAIGEFIRNLYPIAPNVLCTAIIICAIVVLGIWLLLIALFFILLGGKRLLEWRINRKRIPSKNDYYYKDAFNENVWEEEK